MENSRLTRVKRKKANRQATTYIVISILIVVGMIFWGIPEAARLAGLLIQQDNGVQLEDELRPTPPIFSDYPESTKEDSADFTGFAQPGVNVTLYVDGELYKEVLSDDSGTFKFTDVSLTDGDNYIYAYATTSRGTESDKSKEIVVTVDNTPPELVLDSPSDGQVYRGESQRIAEFSGNIGEEEGVKVYVGERVAIVRTDGTFSVSYQMIDGDQEVVVKAVDRAGNETEVTVKLRWES